MKRATITIPAPRRYSTARLRLRRLIRPLSIASVAAVCIAGVTSASTLGAGPRRVQATQELVVLLASHAVLLAAQAGSPEVAVVAAERPITGEQTTLPVIARSIGAGSSRWLQVMIPGRPDGRTGWINQIDTRPLVTPWRIVVDLAARRVKAYRNGLEIRDFQAVVGKPSTPTPTGEFFVEETLKMADSEPGGPFALALSARSNALQEFEGGPGQIAIHGRENLEGTLGSAASHGCIRLATASIDWLAARIGPGTPVTIDAG
jgi:lipoprotein-anchoring transpeptidase ErfK/SrfK